MNSEQFYVDWTYQDRQQINMHDHDLIKTCYEEQDFKVLVSFYEKRSEFYKDYPSLAGLFSDQLPRAKRYAIKDSLK